LDLLGGWAFSGLGYVVYNHGDPKSQFAGVVGPLPKDPNGFQMGVTGVTK